MPKLKYSQSARLEITKTIFEFLQAFPEISTASILRQVGFSDAHYNSSLLSLHQAGSVNISNGLPNGKQSLSEYVLAVFESEGDIAPLQTQYKQMKTAIAATTAPAEVAPVEVTAETAETETPATASRRGR